MLAAFARPRINIDRRKPRRSIMGRSPDKSTADIAECGCPCARVRAGPQETDRDAAAHQGIRQLRDRRIRGIPAGRPQRDRIKPVVKRFSSMRISRRRPARRETPALTPSTAAMFFFLSLAGEAAGKRRRAGSWWRKNSSMPGAQASGAGISRRCAARRGRAASCEEPIRLRGRQFSREFQPAPPSSGPGRALAARR